MSGWAQARAALPQSLPRCGKLPRKVARRTRQCSRLRMCNLSSRLQRHGQARPAVLTRQRKQAAASQFDLAKPPCTVGRSMLIFKALADAMHSAAQRLLVLPAQLHEGGNVPRKFRILKRCSPISSQSALAASLCVQAVAWSPMSRAVTPSMWCICICQRARPRSAPIGVAWKRIGLQKGQQFAR